MGQLSTDLRYAVVFLLLIACTNVTNLLLVRASIRQKELALRAALGAGTWQIARHLLTESLLLALLSGGAGLLMAVWGLSAIKYYGAEQLPHVNQTLDRLKALPGVESAAFVAPMPFSGGNVGADFRIEGRPQPEPGRNPSASVRSVTSQYFHPIRIPLRKGRYFTEQDQRGGIGAAIINETLSRLYFPNEDPIGNRIIDLGVNQNEGDPKQYQIVGVIGDVHHSSLTQPAMPELYLPYQQNSWSWGNFFVRTTNDTTALIRNFTEAVQSSDKTVPVAKVQPLMQTISKTVAQARFYTLLFALFGVTGLLLMLTSIYGVISYTVSQQTPEIGIRMALGAQARDVLKLVVGRGLVLTLIGIGLGLLGALVLTRLMQTLLFNVTATDPLTFAGMAAALALAALVACYIPARRAAKVDPLVALRYE